MGFLYPQFLYALFFLLIPILIHLFNLQRTQKVYFTNLRFLSKVKEQHQNKFKLKRFLILMTRLAFLTFLILAFAQPFWKDKILQKNDGKQLIRAVYLDNSLSMQSKSGNETLLNQGIRYLTDLIDLGKTTMTSVLSNEFSGKSNYFYKKSVALEFLTEISYSPQHRTLASVLKRQQNAFEHLQVKNAVLQQYILSDFQKSTLGDLNELELDSTHQIYLIPLQAEKIGNVYIDSVWLSSPFIRLAENNQLLVRVVNGGDEDVEDLTIQFSIDQLHKSSVTLNVPANGQEEVVLNFSIEQGGLKTCKLTFEDFPVDFDNEYHFVLSANAHVDIAVIEEQENSYIKQVYKNEEVFKTNHLAINNLDFNVLKEADFVILSHVSTWSLALTEALDEILKRGGSILVIPNEKMESTFLNTWLASYSIPAISLENSVKESQDLALIDYKNPFFENVFEEQLNQMQMPKAIPFLKMNAQSESILKFHNRTAFLNRYDVKKGTVYLCASPFQEKYTTFYKHGLFVPIMYKMAMKSSLINTTLSYHLDQSFLKIKGDFQLNSTKPYTLANANGKIIPQQKIVNQELFLQLPSDFKEVGFFDVLQGDSLLTKIALNTSKNESKLALYSHSELEEKLGKYPNIQVLDLKTAIETNNLIKNQVEGFPLWKYSLILCLLFLLIEIALIRFL